MDLTDLDRFVSGTIGPPVVTLGDVDLSVLDYFTSSTVGAGFLDGPSVIAGSVCWGHVTGVTEDNIRTFAAHWTGDGSIEGVGTGDDETIALEAAQYMISEVVNTGVKMVELLQNVYAEGDDVQLQYRHGASQAACEAASFQNYTVQFESLGYVQVKLVSTL